MSNFISIDLHRLFMLYLFVFMPLRLRGMVKKGGHLLLLKRRKTLEGDDIVGGKRSRDGFVLVLRGN